MVNMSVEEVIQLKEGLASLHRCTGLSSAMSANQLDAIRSLQRELEHAVQTPRPHGIKEVEP